MRLLHEKIQLLFESSSLGRERRCLACERSRFSHVSDVFSGFSGRLARATERFARVTGMFFGLPDRFGAVA